MPKKFIITDVSTEIRRYTQEITVPDDKIVYDEDGNSDARETGSIAEDMAQEEGDWDDSGQSDCIENELEAEEQEEDEDVVKYVKGEKVNIKETA